MRFSRSKTTYTGMLPNGISPSSYDIPLSSIPQNWKTLAPFPTNPNAQTYKHQPSLPHLPVPPLQHTLSKLKSSVRAMAASDAEYEAAVAKIDRFGASGAIGERLQERLVKRREEEGKEGGRGHWLEEWWDEVGYMGFRDTIVINVSYYYGFDLPPSTKTPLAQSREDPTMPTQFAIHRAATTVRSALFFRQRLLNGLVPADAVKNGAHCMDSWRWMFDCCRIPHRPSDYAISFRPADPSPEVGVDGHFLVVRKNRFWKIANSIYDPSIGKRRLLSTKELEIRLQYVVEQTKDTLPAIGTFTASDRDSWADNYGLLASISEHNKGVLHDIHSAAFALCMDDVSPKTSQRPSKGPHGHGTSLSTASGSDPVSFTQWLWHGGPAGEKNQLGNRWMDKPIQFILSPNGEMGMVGEHSIMDGTPTTRMCDEVLDAAYSPSFDHGPSSLSGSGSNPEPLDFVVNSALKERIAEAKKRSDEWVGAHTAAYYLTEYGKRQIKKYGVGPDAWTQMAIQLAYDRFCVNHGNKLGSRETGGTYEAATARKFKKGRTEVIRVVTPEVRNWLAAMRDNGTTREERKALFMAAAKQHFMDAQDAGQGMGIDRHLFGLRMLVEEKDGEAALELFDDPVFQRSKKWVLSTSSIFSKHFPIYGWGEVVPDGFGVPYMTGYDDRLQFTITSRKEMDAVGFVDEIRKATNDLRALFGGDVLASKL